MSKTVRRDHYMVKDSWSVPFSAMKNYVDITMRTNRQPEPKRVMGKRWRAEVGGIRYSEMWLRRYVQVRQIASCTVIASDWANRMTEDNKPIVRDLQTDLELLLAHARLLQHTKEVVRKVDHV